MDRLIDRIRTYQPFEFPAMRQHMRRLAEVLEPRALFIACSDSCIGAMKAFMHPYELEKLPAVNAWHHREPQDLASQVEQQCVSLWNVVVANVQLQLQRFRVMPLVRRVEASGDRPNQVA